MTLDRKKFVSDTLFASLPSLAGFLSGLAIMTFITKFVGTAGYGVWAQFQATFSLLSPFLCLNLGTAVGRFLAGEDKRNDYLAKVFYSNLAVIAVLTLATGAIFYLFRERLADWLFGQKEMAVVVALLILFLLFNNLSNQGQHFLMARRYVKEWTLLNLGIFGVSAGLIGLVSFESRNIVPTIAAQVALDAFILLFFLVFIWQKGAGPTKPDFSSISPLLKFSVPLIVAAFGYWIIQSSDRYLLKYFLDISQVGIYSVGYSLAFVLIFFWMFLMNVLVPDLSALFDQGKTREVEIRFSRILKYGVALSVPGVIGLSILAKPLVSVFSSPEFLPASDVLIIVALGVFFYGLFLLFTTLLNVLKKVRLLNSLWIFMAVLNIGLNLWWIPRLGIVGAALATSLAFFSGALLIVLYSRPYLKIIFKKEWLVKIAIASGLMGLAVSQISVSSVFYLALAVLAGALIYGFILFLLKFYDQSEILLLKKVWAGEK